MYRSTQNNSFHVVRGADMIAGKFVCANFGEPEASSTGVKRTVKRDPFMPIPRILAAGCLALLLLAVHRSGAQSDESAKPPVSPTLDRSPVAVAVSPGKNVCAVANFTSDSVSLVDLRTNAILTEHACGRGPVDLAWIDAENLVVSLLHDDAVAMIRISPDRMQTEAIIHAGDEPRGLAVLRDPKTGKALRVCVAISGEDRVAVLDLATRKIVENITVGREPRSVAVSADGKWLVTACNANGDLFVHDATTFKQLSRRVLFDDPANLGVLAILPDSSACIVPHIVNRSFPVDEDNIEKGWVIDNRLTQLPFPGGEYWDQTQIGLDTRGKAVGDPHAVAVSGDGKWLAVTCGGTHELLVFQRDEIPWPIGSPGDFLPYELRGNDERFRRIKLGGRPQGLQFIDNRTVVVANYLLNSLQCIDVAEAKLLRTIALGGPERASQARLGEAIFYDADRSFDSWFSCHTCHTDGHTSGRTFDTVNDGNFDTYKLTPTLRGVTETGPWTWHGWQKDLPAALKKSMQDTLHSKQPFTDAEADTLLQFLRTLKHPESPHRAADGSLTPAAERGKKIFAGKGACANCHKGEYLTSTETYDVGLGSDRYAFPKFNPPSLRGTYARHHFLHDGRAKSLEEVLEKFHRPEKVAGEALTENEMSDLIAYLKSL